MAARSHEESQAKRYQTSPISECCAASGIQADASGRCAWHNSVKVKLPYCDSAPARERSTSRIGQWTGLTYRTRDSLSSCDERPRGRRVSRRWACPIGVTMIRKPSNSLLANLPLYAPPQGRVCGLTSARRAWLDTVWRGGAEGHLCG